jgi:putative hydrolase of the HAD superfamily
MHDLGAILFDADGVIQRASVDYRSACMDLLGARAGEVDRFLTEIFAAERPWLTGAGGFRSDLSALLARWGLEHRMDDTLGIWTAIETDPAMLEAIAALRTAGIACCLATNQTEHRQAYMSHRLGYAELFSREFYSCEVGFAKPDPQYFRALVAALELEPSRILFIDDHEPNVAAARAVGLHGAVFKADRATSRSTLRALLAEHRIRLP